MTSPYLRGIYNTRIDHEILRQRINKISACVSDKPGSIAVVMRAIKDYRETAEKYDAAVFAARFLRCYVIRNAQGDYWNNSFGWVEEISGASLFPSQDVNLPMGGIWGKA